MRCGDEEQCKLVEGVPKCVHKSSCEPGNNPCKSFEHCAMVNGEAHCVHRRGETDDGIEKRDDEQAAGANSGNREEERDWNSVDDDSNNDCEFGYEKIDGGNCTDINECDKGTYICFDTEYCQNTNGSYGCVSVNCEDGFKMASNGSCVAISCHQGTAWNSLWEECRDIDECETKPCKDDERCYNTLGIKYMSHYF